jgi:iron complex transport system permease protein
MVTFAFTGLIAGLGLCFLTLGATVYSLSDCFRVFRGETVPGATFAILTLRLPRLLGGLLAGFSFGLGGSVFQKLLRNPLASPDVIGISSASSAGAIFCLLVLRWKGPLVSGVSALGALFIGILLYGLSRGGSSGGGRLILQGLGLGAMLRSFISYLLLRASQYDVPGAFRWLSGSLNGIQWEDLGPLAGALVIGGPFLFFLSRNIEVLELGEQRARSLGVRVDFVSPLLMLMGIILIAFGTALTGPIAFVSFLSGPIARRLTGFGGILPSGLMGGILVLGGDLLGQFAFDVRFPVGVITGIFGAPYLIFLLIQKSPGGGA